MIRPLRKRHLQIWMLWALLLPLGIAGAVIARRPVPISATEIRNDSLLPLVIKEKTWNGNMVQLRGRDQNTVKQLVWMNKQMLSVASATIYLADADIRSVSASKYLGRIESRGNYVFDLPAKNRYHFIIYDFIHKQIIDTIHFEFPSGKERRAL